MRFLLGSVAGLALGLAVTPKVVGLTKECFPSCTTFTAPFSGSGPGLAIDEKTPWSGQIGIDKFDSQGGTRMLTGVEIKTILYFNTSIFIQRASSSQTGSVVAGAMLHMDLHDNPGLLGQYWGRWGNYAELDGDTLNDAFSNQGQNGIDVTGLIDPGTFSSSTNPLFVEYTYPLFDVIGAVSCGGSGVLDCNGNTPLPLPLSPGQSPSGALNSGPVWAYYTPSSDTGTLGWPQYFYGTVSRGTYVERIDDPDQPNFSDSTYFNQGPEDLLNNEQSFVVDSIPPDNNLHQVGTTVELNRFSEPLAFSKSISLSDLDGGVGRNISAHTILALFDNANGGGNQILFDAAATGQYAGTLAGGNSGLSQTTYAKVAVRVEYTYALTAQDPQFGGFQGQSFQVHGYPGSYFNLFSAPSFQMNGRFTYLATGHCKYSHTPCWTHPGTYIDEVAFVVDELLIRVTAGPVGSGYAVMINNEPFHAHKHANESIAVDDDPTREFVPTKFYDPNTRVMVHLKSPLELVIRTELVSFALHNADHFFNLDSQLLVRPLLKLGRKPSLQYPDPVTGKPGFPEYPIHGFIGQTWANKKYPNKRQYQGEPDDYVEPRPYATESLYSQYNKQFDDKQTQWQEN